MRSFSKKSSMDNLDHRAIVVLGMHRSGTSALSGILNHLGIYVGRIDDMIPSDMDNPMGFWEHSGILSIHEDILNTLGRSWDMTIPMPKDWYKLKEMDSYIEKLKNIIREEFIEQPVWGWKDPRTCLLLPLWRSILQDMGVHVSYLITVRNPLDVAVSLNRRNYFSKEKSLVLWYLYTLNALYWSEKNQRALISYERLLIDWRKELTFALDKLGIAMPENSELYDKIDKFIKPSLCHSYSSINDLDVQSRLPIKHIYHLCCVDGIDSDESIKSFQTLYHEFEDYGTIISHQPVKQDIQRCTLYGLDDRGSYHRINSQYIIQDGQLHLYEFPLNDMQFAKLRLDFEILSAIAEISSIVLYEVDSDTKHKEILVDFSRDSFSKVKFGKDIFRLNNDNTFMLLSASKVLGLIMPVDSVCLTSGKLVLEVSVSIETKPSSVGEAIAVLIRESQQQEEQLSELILESHSLQEMRSNSWVVAQESISRIVDKLKYPKYVLAVSQSNYVTTLGGIEKLLNEEQTDLYREKISYVQLYPAGTVEGIIHDSLHQLVGVNVDGFTVGHYTIPQLCIVLKLLHSHMIGELTAIHLHHIMNLSVTGLHYLINSFQAQVRIFFHDYYTICQQYNLLRNGQEYCGAPQADSQMCKTCKWGEKRGLHLDTIKLFFKALKMEFITPSSASATILAETFPEYTNNNRIRIVPYQVVKPIETNIREKKTNLLLEQTYRPRLAYVGYEATNKGYEVWRNLAVNEKIQESYELFHVGAHQTDINGVQTISVSFLKEGPDAMIKALKENQIDISLLWSLWPETYSYTMFESFAANCFVLTNKVSGNISEQVQKSGRGIVFNNEQEMMDFLLNVSEVKQAALCSLKEHGPLKLQYNSELTMEIAGKTRLPV